ncbi:MAG: DUF3568 family protein [Candidatus Omnitrophota bacterium]|jgi:hypothetical protein
MKKLAVFCVMISFLFISITGCAPLIVGAVVGGVGGYAISKDTMQGESDTPYDTLWAAAERISKIRGKLKREDMNRGVIELEADSSRVSITLVRLTRATTRLKVSARKYYMPNLKLAQDIFMKIMEETK